MRKTILSVSLAVALVPLGASAQLHPDDWEKVLLPLAPIGELQRGAYGSLWKTEWTVFNGANEPVFLFQDFIDFCPFTCSSFHPLEPSQAASGVLAAGNGGTFVYVERPFNQDVGFQLRIRDLSRQGLSWGTEIPVVREREAFTSTLDLIDIPIDLRFRHTLRVYEFEARSSSEVDVRIWNQATRTLVAERRLTLGHIGPQRVIFPLFPGYAQLGDLVSEFPMLFGIERIRAEIEPVTAGLKIWAFVSITNNETQHVTTVTPQ